MSSRAYLHQLVYHLRRHLQWQRAEGLTGVVPATQEVRDAYVPPSPAPRQAAASTPQPPRRESLQGTPASPVAPASATPAPAARETTAAPTADGAPGGSQLWKNHRPLYELKKPRQAPSQSHQSNQSPQRGQSTSQDPRDPAAWPAARKMAWLNEHLSGCTRCPLHAGRTNLVFGVGDPEARLMFIGEGPGYDDDQRGEPFVGKSGELLTKMIGAMGFSRDEIYIANVVKCRPPDNREPAPEEVATCSPFLKKQIDVIQPEVIVTLGGFAANTLLGADASLGDLRGRWHDYQGIAVMPTYHPEDLLRNDEAKKPAWEDLKQVIARLRT